MITVGDRLPDAELGEYVEVEGNGCAIGPNRFRVSELARGKRVVIVALPGAFTPTCSSRHIPGFLERYQQFRDKGIDEIWCVSVNDAHVMGAWARDQGTAGKIRMLADGNAEFTAALGLTIDLSRGGMGTRSRRYSMLVDDGVVKAFNLEQPGKFEVSDADTMLAQL